MEIFGNVKDNFTVFTNNSIKELKFESDGENAVGDTENQIKVKPMIQDRLHSV